MHICPSSRRLSSNSPGNSVLSAALNVESNQIETSLASVEKVVADVVHKPAVKPGQDEEEYEEEENYFKPLTVVPGETGHEAVQHPWKSQKLWFVERLLQIKAGVQLAPHSVVDVDDVRDEAVPEPEGCRGKLVCDPRVEGGVVVLAVSGGKWEEPVGVDELLAQHDRQPLVVDDVLVLRVDKPLCLLEHSLVRPGLVALLQLRSHSVVLTEEDCVQDGQVGLLVHLGSALGRCYAKIRSALIFTLESPALKQAPVHDSSPLSEGRRAPSGPCSALRRPPRNVRSERCSPMFEP